jgi:allantoate deiminase
MARAAGTADLRARILEIGAIGADPEGGCTRLAYTAAEREAHDLLARWAGDLGASVEVDPVGNSICVFDDREPYLLLGSHLDTVRQGGMFDGVAGVLVGLAAAERLRPEHHGLRVIAFAGEEGARFGRPNLGSALAAGMLSAADAQRLVDQSGVSLLTAAGELGFDLRRASSWLDRRVAGFVECHIEQGQVLETTGTSIGLVDAIAGSIRMRVRFTGVAAHSGATPMGLRHDALLAAAEAAVAVEQAARIGRQTVATVGKFEVRPNSITTVPGHAEISVDIRDVDPETQRRCARQVVEAIEEIAERRRVGVEIDVISSQSPVMLASWLRNELRLACEEAGVRYRVLPSGAGHDAAIAARRTDAAMVFVPCRNGVSHSPDEHASEEDLALAVDVIVDALERVDRIGARSG